MKRSLLEIINEVLEDQKLDNISPEMNLRYDIGMDSLKLAHLTVLVEDEYGVDIFENGLVETVSDVLKKIDG
jgi:acyl carrier protein